ncbi:AAA family ATPase [Alteromonas marina]
MTLFAIGSKIENLEVRVTSIRQLSESTAMFAGIAANDTCGPDTSTLIFVSTHPNNLGGMEPAVGQYWKICGSCSKSTQTYNKYTRHVLIVDASKADCIVPVKHEALIQFISQCKDFAGISVGKARKLIKAFPNDPYQAVLDNDAKTISRVSNLTPKAAVRLKRGFRKYQNMKYAKWLSDYAVPLSIISRIIEYHDFKTIDLITENPWRLMDFGMSFTDASAIARRILNVDSGEVSEEQFKTDPRRIIAATEDVMQIIARRGHTVATYRQITNYLSKKHFERALAEAAIELAVRFKKLICVADNLYQLTGTYMHEAVIAKRLLKLTIIEQWGAAEDAAFKKALYANHFELTNNQRLATQRSAMHGVSVITGGAGTGKTTVLQTVLRTYSNLGYTTHGVAVAGRAAMRMHESTGCNSCTIAKYLRTEPPKHGDKYVLVIDEASMLDVQTTFAVLTHIPDTARIIFVGDVQQLPSIGAGRVFADIINSKKVPVTVLDVVKRQDDTTGIPSYSKSIINGEVPEYLTQGNITFHDVNIEAIERTADELLTINNDETQIIGMTRKGAENRAGIEQINRNAQANVNQNGTRLTVSANGQHQFMRIRENDRVIFTRNNYDKGVWNGTLGVVKNVNCHDDVYAHVSTDDGDIIEITHSVLFDIQLSYAITLHKAQGSQFKRVIIVLTNKSMLDRSWLYTAITRAEYSVDIVGPKELLLQAIRTKSKETQRQTRLKSLIEGNFVLLKPQEHNSI